MAGACPSSSGHKAGPHPGQDILPSQGHSHTPTFRLKQCRHTDSPHMHIFGMWEKTGDPRGNLCKLHTDSGPRLRIDVFPQHYNEVTLNRMLFEDLLYSSPLVNDTEKPLGKMPTTVSFCFCDLKASRGEIHWKQLHWRFKDD